MEGAVKMLREICSNEEINTETDSRSGDSSPGKGHIGVSHVYKDFLETLSQKLEVQKKQTHTGIIRQYNSHKIRMLNYFTTIGKLKALFKI